jgi:hypothetical protein
VQSHITKSGDLGTATPSDGSGCIHSQMETQAFAREVEDAAECFSWGPSVLRKWLVARERSSAFEQALQELVNGADPESAARAVLLTGSDGLSAQTLETAVRLVFEGATPNTIRARLAETAASPAHEDRQAA